ncbi:MOSC domain-containing protein [Pikeienuella piscinae]|uniref:MOSC domain-containing protein n=1 Tax=Pikeienuella piscinae TaxID=2748098 RepID=A0A7L5BZN8_9RHOB|nr:MOSC domain-containing protein [Pikeienuella piscinae]QIE55987.1 MOSC domain-containing protein [Pikeienuella piscinae]
MNPPYILSDLINRHATVGRIDWIGLRPARLETPLAVEAAHIEMTGLLGDHRARPGKRAVTLIQAEHLPVIAALAGLDAVAPETLRRNLVVSRINIAALRRAKLRIGGALLRMTGPCAPCSRMERALGFGGFNAMRGHGGWTAEVIEPGEIRLGDAVAPEA